MWKQYAGVAALLAASMGVSSAQVGDPIANPHGMVENFDAANLGTVLTDLGIVWQERPDGQGRTFIAASLGGQLNFNIVPTACLGPNNSKCVGVTFLALFNGATPNYQTVSAFNQKYFFSSAGVLPNGAGAYVSRYEIADYRIPRGNVASSLQTFVQLADQFRREVSTSTQTVSQEGYAEDLSANYLNKASAEGFGARSHVQASSFADLHRDALDATPKLVRDLMNAENAPRNKIENIRSE